MEDLAMAKKQKGKRGGTRAGAGRPTIYGKGMGTKEFHLSGPQTAWLEREAGRRGVTQAAVVRELVDFAMRKAVVTHTKQAV